MCICDHELRYVMYLEALGNNCCRLSWLTCANDWFKKIGIWAADACVSIPGKPLLFMIVF